MRTDVGQHRHVGFPERSFVGCCALLEGCQRNLRRTPSSQRPATTQPQPSARRPRGSQRLGDSFLVITDQGAGGRSRSQAPPALGGGLPEPGGEIWAAQPRWRAARRRLMRAGTAGGEGSSPPHWPPPPLTHPAPRPSSPAPN